jgi:hypothetical protein
VVSESSAIFGLPNSLETRVPIYKNHSYMIKFDHYTDQAYISVHSKLLDLRAKVKRHDPADLKVRRLEALHYLFSEAYMLGQSRCQVMSC